MKLVVLALVAAGLTGCATGASRNGVGLIYTDVTDSVTATANVGTSKKGQSCATNVLSMVSTGDMSIETAKRAGDISKVATVDYSQYSILGVFAKTCVIVTGE